MRELLISAAEPSGDRLGAELVTALQAQGPLRARGVAGPAMRAAGVEAVARTEDIGVMGVVEVLRHLRTVQRARRALSDAIASAPPDTVLVCVDAPDFHLPLARGARERGLQAVGYVSPQVWAWRPGRVERIAAGLDSLLCLFDFEPTLYPAGFDVRWVGHPVVDRLPPRGQVLPHVYGLLPGSRAQEIRRMLPVFLAAAERVRATEPRASFRLVAPEHLLLPDLPEWVQREVGIEALSSARAALTKSGTATLELAVMGVPQVVAHRVHPLTYWLGRLVVRGVEHVAMPNVLADRRGGAPPVPEHLQHLDPGRLAADLLALPEVQPVDLAGLGDPGAAARAAAAVAEKWA